MLGTAWMRWLIVLTFSLVALNGAGKELTLHVQSVESLQDVEGKLNIGDLAHADWKSERTDHLNFGFYKGVIWLRIRLSGDSDNELLELRNPNLDKLLFYVKDGTTYRKELLTGDHFPYSSRKFKHRYFQFPLNGKNEVLIKVTNYGDQLFIPLGLHTPKQVAARDYDEQLLFGIYYGLCFFAFFLNFFLYVKVKEASNLFYAFYLIGLILLQLALDGHGSQYFWGDVIYFTNHAPPLMASASVLALILFTKRFLRTDVLVPKVNRFFDVIAWLLGVNVMLSVIPATYTISILAINGLTLMLNLLIIPVAVYSWRQRFKPARFFLSAFVVLIFSVFAFVLRNFGILPSTFMTDYALQVGSALEVVLLSFAVVDKFKSFRDDAVRRLEEINYLQSKQNEMLENEVRTRTARISEQKNQLEQTNKEIIDSINYAKRIQTALIPTVDEFRRFLPDSFVFWEPKDIVSGDFYWASEVTTTFRERDNFHMTVFCVGDCTGHGVPGAILSVLGLKILNLSLKDPNVNSTAQALDFLHEQFNRTFHLPNNQPQVRDGMDIAFCALDRENGKLYFSGAKHNLFVVRSGELIELKGDRMSIGSVDNQAQFSQQVMNVRMGDMIYLVSDGLADQFGGPQGKKFKFATVKELFLRLAPMEVQTQRDKVQETFYNWKGNLEQTDDICLVGVRV